MVFDANLVLHDGTAVTADISPTSETRSSGSAVIDLLQGTNAAGLGMTPALGLAAVLIVTADLAETSDTLQVTIEECSTVNGTYTEMARFPLLTQGTGMPGTYIERFVAENRYIRGAIDITDDDSGGDFSATFYLLLSQYPFRAL